LTEKVSEAKKAEVVRLLFLGHSWDEIVSEANVSKGTMKKVADSLYEIYGEEDVKNTIETIKAIKGAGITTTDAISGARYNAIINKLKLDDDAFFRFVSKVYENSQKYDLEPEELVKISSSLFEIKSQTDISLDEIPHHITKLLDEKKRLADIISDLNKEREEDIQRRQDAFKRLEVTEEALDEYITTKKSLQENGIELGDLDKLKNILREISKLDYDPKEITKCVSEEQDLETRNKILQNNISSLQVQVEQKKQEIVTLESGKKTISDNIKKLKTSHLGLVDAISSIESIRQNGIDPLRIVQWEEILKACGTKPYGFEEQIKQYGSLENRLQDIKKNIIKSEKEEISLKSRIGTLSKEKETVESSLLQTRDMTLKMLDEVQNNTVRVISELGVATTNSIDQTRKDSIKKINDVIDNTALNLKETARTFEGMIVDISTKSEQFGKLASIAPLYELVVETRGEPHKVMVSTIIFLTHLLSWLDMNPDHNSIKSSVQSVKSQIERSLVNR
jgi:hypothetical protein